MSSKHGGLRDVGADRRRGISLIEVVVVVSVIGVLAAILLVAVVRAREASRRIQCLNHMKQLGIAINAHLESKKYYPRGENAYSAFVSLLPYLENVALYNSINLSRPQLLSPGVGVNDTAFRTGLAVLVCPSDGGDGGSGGTNYGGNLGTGVGPYGRPNNGPFASSLLDPAIRDSLVRDGLANTVAVSEFCHTPGFGRRDDKRSIFHLGAFEVGQFPVMLSECKNLDSSEAPLSILVRGHSWGVDGIGTTLYDHNAVPNSHTCSTNGLMTGVWTASSMHSEGVNCVFLEGHARTTSGSVSLQIWNSLGTMNGGEIVEN